MSRNSRVAQLTLPALVVFIAVFGVSRQVGAFTPVPPLSGEYRIYDANTNTKVGLNAQQQLVAGSGLAKDSFRLVLAEAVPQGNPNNRPATYYYHLKSGALNLHNDGLGNNLITTLAGEETDAFTRFRLVQQGNGLYQIQTQATGKFWNLNLQGDRLVTTRGGSPTTFRLQPVGASTVPTTPLPTTVTNPNPEPQTVLRGGHGELPLGKNGYYYIRVQATRAKVNYDGDGFLTLSQKNFGTDAYLFDKRAADGHYWIQIGGTRRLHDNGNFDKYISTRYDADDDFTKFKVERQSDGTYRIKTKASNSYWHVNPQGDQRVSSGATADNPWSRFLIEPVFPADPPVAGPGLLTNYQENPDRSNLLPNTEFLGKGVNIFKLDPAAYGSSQNPGYTFGKLFQLTNSYERTSDNRTKPYGVSYFPGASTNENYVRKMYSTAVEYTDSFGVDVGLSAGLKGVSFTASNSYTNENTESLGKSHINVVHSILRSTHRLDLNETWSDATGNQYGQRLTQEFKQAVANLPIIQRMDTFDPYNPRSEIRNWMRYEEVLARFGTHYTSAVYYGGIYEKKVEISKSVFEESNLSENEFKLGVEAGMKGMSVGVDFGITTSNGQTYTEQSQEITRSVSIQGGSDNTQISNTTTHNESGVQTEVQNVRNFDFGQWQRSVDQRPVPVQFRFRKLSHLLTREFFPNDSQIDQKRKALEHAIRYQIDRQKWIVEGTRQGEAVTFCVATNNSKLRFTRSSVRRNLMVALCSETCPWIAITTTQAREG